MCLPSPDAFQIHFQVNTVWPTANLQPTGVVTAVADNGKSKLQPSSGMFTVTTGRLVGSKHLFFQHFPKEGSLIINFILTNYSLNLSHHDALRDLVYAGGKQWRKKGHSKWIFYFRLKKREVNTFLSTTSGCSKEYSKRSAFLSQSRNHLVFASQFFPNPRKLH